MLQRNIVSFELCSGHYLALCGIMASHQAARPIARRMHSGCLRSCLLVSRPLSSTASCRDQSLESTSSSSSAIPPPPSPPPPSDSAPPLDPNLAHTATEERQLYAQGISPIGSRRRRAALASAPDLPFTQLPYACFQEARKILRADREAKLQQIATERLRIRNVYAKDAAAMGGANAKRAKLGSMLRHLERLKVLADINDPLVKKRFEDGDADMDKPIYRYLAQKKWESYNKPLVLQRLQQMHVVPDLLPDVKPSAAVALFFRSPRTRRGLATPPGTIVPARISANAPRLEVQVFDRGPRLVSVAVVDADVPNAETDGFDQRCHFLAVNVPVAPSNGRIEPWTMAAATTDAAAPVSEAPPEGEVVPAAAAGDAQRGEIVVPWMPPHAQKGSPYHRLAVFVLEQPRPDLLLSSVRAIADGMPNTELARLPAESLRKQHEDRMKFSVRHFAGRHKLRVAGATMFRSLWDEGTAGVMRAAGLPGAEVEWRRKRGERLPDRLRKRDKSRMR